MMIPDQTSLLSQNLVMGVLKFGLSAKNAAGTAKFWDPHDKILK